MQMLNCNIIKQAQVRDAAESRDYKDKRPKDKLYYQIYKMLNKLPICVCVSTSSKHAEKSYGLLINDNNRFFIIRNGGSYQFRDTFNRKPRWKDWLSDNTPLQFLSGFHVQELWQLLIFHSADNAEKYHMMLTNIYYSVPENSRSSINGELLMYLPYNIAELTVFIAGHLDMIQQLTRTTNADFTWGVPRGKREKTTDGKNTYIDTAKREFLEEVGFDCSPYLLINSKSICISYKEANTAYELHLYPALLISDKKEEFIRLTRIANMFHRTSEFTGCGWLTKNNFRYIPKNNTVVAQIFINNAALVHNTFSRTG